MSMGHNSPGELLVLLESLTVVASPARSTLRLLFFIFLLQLLQFTLKGFQHCVKLSRFIHRRIALVLQRPIDVVCVKFQVSPLLFEFCFQRGDAGFVVLPACRQQRHDARVVNLL